MYLHIKLHGDNAAVNSMRLLECYAVICDASSTNDSINVRGLLGLAR